MFIKGGWRGEVGQGGRHSKWHEHEQRTQGSEKLIAQIAALLDKMPSVGQISF